MQDTNDPLKDLVLKANALRILILLSDGEQSFRDLIAKAGMSPPTVAKWIAILDAMGLVSRRRDGRTIYHSLTKTGIAYLRELFTKLAGFIIEKGFINDMTLYTDTEAKIIEDEGEYIITLNAYSNTDKAEPTTVKLNVGDLADLKSLVNKLNKQLSYIMINEANG